MISRFGVVSVVLLALAGCGGGGNNSANSPLAPGSTTLTGVWTGTVTRPAGAPALSIRWDTGVDNYSMTGPMTVTVGGVSATTSAQGNVAGNDANGYTIFMSFNSQGPGCTIRGNSAGPQAGDAFPSPFKTISIPAFRITYVGCQDLLGPSGLFLEETVQVAATKQ